MEGAAGRQVEKIRHRSGDSHQRLSPSGTKMLDGAQQSLRVGVESGFEQRVGRGELDNLARIHDQHAVGHLAHDAEIVPRPKNFF